MHDEVLAINVRLQPAERAALDSWRRSFENPPSRSRAVHTLVVQGLQQQVSTEPRHV